MPSISRGRKCSAGRQLHLRRDGHLARLGAVRRAGRRYGDQCRDPGHAPSRLGPCRICGSRTDPQRRGKGRRGRAIGVAAVWDIASLLCGTNVCVSRKQPGWNPAGPDCHPSRETLKPSAPRLGGFAGVHAAIQPTGRHLPIHARMELLGELGRVADLEGYARRSLDAGSSPLP